MNTEYQLCTRCVMDSSDPAISFNTQGICNHCREFDEVTSKGWFPNEEGAQHLAVMVDQIKEAVAAASAGERDGKIVLLPNG